MQFIYRNIICSLARLFCCLPDYLFKSTFTMKYSVLTDDTRLMSKLVCYVNKCTIIINFCFEDGEYKIFQTSKRFEYI